MPPTNPPTFDDVLAAVRDLDDAVTAEKAAHAATGAAAARLADVLADFGVGTRGEHAALTAAVARLKDSGEALRAAVDANRPDQ